MRRVFDVVHEPRDEVLRQLIHAIAQHSSIVVMVVRDDLGLSETGRSLLARLRPYLEEENRGSSWPGTALLNEEATISRFSLSGEVVDELIAAANGLYAWQQPMLPEDLAFLRDDATPILASICHEQDAYLDVSEEEYQSLTASVPGLREILRPHVESE